MSGQALHYKSRGRRNLGRPRKRWTVGRREETIILILEVEKKKETRTDM
jgi:hypothetical protein